MFLLSQCLLIVQAPFKRRACFPEPRSRLARAGRAVGEADNPVEQACRAPQRLVLLSKKVHFSEIPPSLVKAPQRSRVPYH